MFASVFYRYLCIPYATSALIEPFLSYGNVSHFQCDVPRYKFRHLYLQVPIHASVCYSAFLCALATSSHQVPVLQLTKVFTEFQFLNLFQFLGFCFRLMVGNFRPCASVGQLAFTPPANLPSKVFSIETKLLRFLASCLMCAKILIPFNTLTSHLYSSNCSGFLF